jgi:DNA-binding PadR family transcriptional regulator
MRNYAPGPSSIGCSGTISLRLAWQKLGPNVVGIFTLRAVTPIVTTEANRSKTTRKTTFQFKHITSFALFNGNKDFGSKKHISLSANNSEPVSNLEPKILEVMHRRIIKNFLDVVILMELRKRSMSGYDVILLIHNKFHILLSSGTVYSNLYFLGRNGLIENKYTQRKRVYTLTERGKENVEAFMNAKDKILGLVLNLFVDE